MHNLLRLASTPFATALGSLFLITIFNTISQARIINVPEDFQTIQAGIDSSSHGDTVLVRPGRYSYINFNGYLITVGSLYLTTGNERYIDSTIIDAAGQPVSVVRFNNREDSTARLTGFTLTGGTGSLDLEQDTCGGGIHCLAASPTLDHLTIRGNRAEFGGGIFLQGSHPKINCIKIDNNLASWYGGGMHISRNSRAVIEKAVFAGNHGGSGSAISLFGSSRSIIRNSTFCNNSSGGRESLFRLYHYGEMNLIDCIITGNQPDTIMLKGNPAGNTINIDHCLLNGGFWMVRASDTTDTINWLDGNFSSNPLFLNPDNGDYSLTANSPCIDAGDPDSPLDPDGTRSDMGAFYFHQRDIAVDETEVHFPPRGFGERDSLSVTVSNTGLTLLHITEISRTGSHSFTAAPIGAFDPPIEIAPDSSMSVWIFYAPCRDDDFEGSFVIHSDDPDESEITITVGGDFNGIGADKRDAYPMRFGVEAFPNPFNLMTTIRYSTSPINREATNLRVYGLDGRLVADLSSTATCGEVAGETVGYGDPTVGEHSIIWNAEGLPGGMYLIRLEAGSETRTIKTILMK